MSDSTTFLALALFFLVSFRMDDFLKMTMILLLRCLGNNARERLVLDLISLKRNKPFGSRAPPTVAHVSYTTPVLLVYCSHTIRLHRIITRFLGIYTHTYRAPWRHTTSLVRLLRSPGKRLAFTTNERPNERTNERLTIMPCRALLFFCIPRALVLLALPMILACMRTYIHTLLHTTQLSRTTALLCFALLCCNSIAYHISCLPGSLIYLAGITRKSVYGLSRHLLPEDPHVSNE